MSRIAPFVVGLALAGLSSAGDVPGDFSFSMPYVPGGRGTAWDLPGRTGELHVSGGRHYCVFLGDLEVPAGRYRDPYTGEYAWRCPDVTVRHLRQILMVREGGECRGFTCEYDVVYPGPQAGMVTGVVSHCPDIVVTSSGDGRMRVLGAKYYRRGDNPGRYTADGVPGDIFFDISHRTKPGKFGKCADPVYRGQVDYYEGPDMHRRNTRDVYREVESGWDGR